MHISPGLFWLKHVQSKFTGEPILNSGWTKLPPRILECKFTHKHSLPQLGWSTERKHDLCMDVRHVNALIDGQLQNTSRSLLEAKGCQLWGMRGLVLLGKWSGVWLSGRKEVLINFEKATAQQPQACLLPHTDTHSHTYIIPSKAHTPALTVVHYCTGELVCCYTKRSD